MRTTGMRRWRLRAAALGTVFCLIATLAVLAAPPSRSATARPAASVKPAASVRVGRETLHRCGNAYCGELPVPLDYGLAGGPDIDISFSWYPATDQSTPTLGTLMPVEGGPGYPSTNSVAPDGYADMYGPLLTDHNMLAIALRGTGKSAVISCPDLQNFAGAQSGSTSTADFDSIVGACGASLNTRWHTASGAPIHASDLFTTAFAAKDVAQVLAALEINQVDLYGDSYGSWFAQIFASRYPQLVRSVILDSTYGVQQLNPWYASTLDSMPADFEEACTRSAACSAAEPESAWTRISQLTARLRTAPISGSVPGPDGREGHETMGVLGVVDLVSDAAEDQAIYSELDAAARALLENNDPAPLLRLYAQRLNYDEEYFHIPAPAYSGGLYFAVSCLDYPQLFDMNSTPAQRLVELAKSEKGHRQNAFAPFTVSEFLSMDQYSETFTGCLDWPAPTISKPPVGPNGLALPSTMPVLILGGEFDTWTPPSGIPQVLSEIGGHTRVVIMANSIHVVGEGQSTGCASTVLREFVSDPGALDSIDTSCAAQVPAIHSVGVYPLTLGQTPPLTPTAGSTSAAVDLEAGAAAIDTAGDAVNRFTAITLTHDVGLHGGSVVSTPTGLQLTNDQLVPGVAVSGNLTVGTSVVTGDLTETTPGGLQLSLHVSWSRDVNGALATASGLADGVPVVGTVPAP